MAIITDYPATLRAIANCIGKTVSGIARVQSYINDQEDTDGFGVLEFTFRNNSHLTLSGMGDAETIEASNTKAYIPPPFNHAGNDICSWKKIDMKDDIGWGKIIGQTLQNAEIVWSISQAQEDNPIACVLHFNADYVTFNMTSSDANEFFVNKPLSLYGKTRIEKIN